MDDEDDCVLFGTPLPEIEDETTLRKKAAKELEVRDEKGRQRFHGAFTGGFSAGYFNTVGTKEGWAPSTFISSRDKIADRIQQNPEDFMDDEDLGEFGISTRKIHTTSNFEDTSERKAKKRYIDDDAVIPGDAPLNEIVQPVRESIGIIILKKLGWREGQGIGPRVKKTSMGPKIYGCSPFPDTSTADAEEDDPVAALFTFAPKDTQSMSYKSKDNFFGLGYTGLSKKSVLSSCIDPFSPTSTKSWLAKDKKKLKISGQAFGVGAFEDDDEDIYGKDDMTQYDFSELAPKEAPVKAIGGSKYGSPQEVIEGFHLATQPPVVKKHYAPPTLPPNFKPFHLKTVSTGLQKENLVQSQPLVQSRHSLSAAGRSLLLGERKFQKVSLNDPVVQSKKSEPELPQSLSSAGPSNFRPFSNDLSKQQRYDEYLRLKRTGDISKFIQPSSMTEWEKQQELEEFAKASILFKPLSSALSSRFESRSHLSAEHEVMAAIEKIKKEKEEKQAKVVKKSLVGTSNRKTLEWHPVPLLCKRMNVPNPYPNSSSSGAQKIVQSKSVFDHLSFTSEKSQDSEKSNCSTPAVNNTVPDQPKEASKAILEEIPAQVFDNAAVEKTTGDTTAVTLSENKRPSMDFFKDIFENSSSDEEAEKEEKSVLDNIVIKTESPESISVKETAEKETNSQNLVAKETAEQSNDQRCLNSSLQCSSSCSKKVGFGVFANLDLDALNRRKPPGKPLPPDASPSKNEDVKDAKVSNGSKPTENLTKADDTYGPELPPDYSIVENSVPTLAVSANSSRKHAKSKSNRKHKHHKHKHKKKKKKSARRDSSSSVSSENELEDIPPSLIIEK